LRFVAVTLLQTLNLKLPYLIVFDTVNLRDLEVYYAEDRSMVRENDFQSIIVKQIAVV